jgi:hypothetical protein
MATPEVVNGRHDERECVTRTLPFLVKIQIFSLSTLINQISLLFGSPDRLYASSPVRNRKRKKFHQCPIGVNGLFFSLPLPPVRCC